MPDEKSLNAVLGAYGISNPLSSGFNWWNLALGFIFGIIGWYAFMHGKKEKNYRPMVVGIALMVYTFFVSNAWLTFAIGSALTAALYFWKE